PEHRTWALRYARLHHRGGELALRTQRPARDHHRKRSLRGAFSERLDPEPKRHPELHREQRHQANHTAHQRGQARRGLRARAAVGRRPRPPRLPKGERARWTFPGRSRFPHPTWGNTTLLSLTGLDGGEVPALIYDVSRDPVSGRMLHVDFARVSLTEKTHADVPLHFVKESPAVRTLGAVLLHARSEVSVE